MIKRLYQLVKSFHLHRWEYTAPVYGDRTMERLAIPSIEATRTCSICHLKQSRDEHCLGLNPPDYIYNWYTSNDN